MDEHCQEYALCINGSVVVNDSSMQYKVPISVCEKVALHMSQIKHVKASAKKFNSLLLLAFSMRL